MKRRTKGFFALLALMFVFTISCEKNNDEPTDQKALELPPYESMAMDFGDFSEASNSKGGKTTASASKVGVNWVYSSVVVGVWNVALYTTLAVPVASFKTAFTHKAKYIGGQKWQWIYTVDGFTSQYNARLTGELKGEEVIWEMYITKSGIGAFDEFLWFSGSSAIDGNSGYWILNHSAEHPNNVLRIDWEREQDEIGSIKYTWVRQKDNQGNVDTFKDSYLEYGLQEGDLDATFSVHAFDNNLDAFVDVNIEWSRTAYNGRVMAPQYFEDEDWHCWDSKGDDVACE